MKVNAIVNPLVKLRFESSNSSSVAEHHANHAHEQDAGLNLESLWNSFLTMWLPMFMAMAIKLPGVGSLPKVARAPVEVSLKAGLGLLLSEALRLVLGSKPAHYH